MAAGRRRWVLTLAAVIVTGMIAAATPAVRTPILQALGRSLVVDEYPGPADAIVISVDAYHEGVLEAADLVRNGTATRVAVFADPPDVVDREYIRRGIPYEDVAARAARHLTSLGVPTVERIQRTPTGTEDEASLIPVWCAERGFDSIVVVTTPDHSRRVRRVLNRSMKGRGIRVSVRFARYSGFDPNTWWHTRAGARTAIVELQKLLLDIARHPIS
jgi:hypothetical protein